MSKIDLNHGTSIMLDRASAWYLRIHGAEATDRDIQQHADWLLEDPTHLLAYEQVAETVKSASIFEAAARTMFSDVFNSESPKTHGHKGWRTIFSQLTWPQYAITAAAVAAMAFIAILPNTALYDNPSTPHYFRANTDRIETVKLADGSRVSMFMGSEMTFTIKDGARIVDLPKGRAFFDVVSDNSKPFYVNFSDHQVRVVGTRFEVVNLAGLERVAVNKGLVSVAMRASEIKKSAPILLEPGITVEFQTANPDPILNAVDPRTIGAWKEGVLVFKDAPLDKVVASIDQLFPATQITLGDASLKTRNFSGALVVSNSETMSKQLAQFLSLNIHVTGSSILLDTK